MKAKKMIPMFMSLVLMVTMLIPQTVFATGGTEGDEMQVMEPEQLEIQLGTDWAGVEFELKTDAGMYPGTIPVGEDGVLRLEIGGSSTYILTCLNSEVSVPDPTQAPATEEADTTDDTAEESAQTETGTSEESSGEVMEETAPEDQVDGEEENTIAGIPVMHLALFGGGLLIAVAALVGMRVASRRKAIDADYEEEDED